MKRSLCKEEIKEIFGSCLRGKNNIKYARNEENEVFAVMSYNYMLLALYSLKSFFSLVAHSFCASHSQRVTFFCQSSKNSLLNTQWLHLLLRFMNSNCFSKRHIHVEFLGFWHVEFFPSRLLSCFANCVCVYVFIFFLSSNIFDLPLIIVDYRS